MVFCFPNPKARLPGGEADPNTAGRHKNLFCVYEMQEFCREVLKFNVMGRLPVWRIMYAKKYLIKT